MLFDLKKHLLLPKIAGRTFFCGDVHGEYDLLMRGLDGVGFSDADRLVLVGDLIDRGLNSERVLGALFGTSNFFSVIGNHELVFAAAAHSYDMKQMHLGIGGDWTDDVDYYELMRLRKLCVENMPILMTVETDLANIGVVHAGSPMGCWKASVGATIDEAMVKRCTWAFNSAFDQIYNIGYVVSGHTSTLEIESKGNQRWIDTLLRGGRLSVIDSNHL